MITANKKVCFSIDCSDYGAHLFNITLDMDHPTQDQEFSLPVWAPGSYMIREFAQHIVSIKASSNGQDLNIIKINKNTFKIRGIFESIKLNYQVYAFDSSIRAAYLDNTQGFFNGAALFLCPLGFEDALYNLLILRPQNECQQEWQVATTMPIYEKLDQAGFGSYKAANYDEFIDHPVQISPIKRLRFNANTISHEVALVGDVRDFDEQRLATDLTKLCEKHIEMFGGIAPFERYLFIVRFEEGGYGGLEHRNSSMILVSPYCLPKLGLKEPDARYRSFLGLLSHEYFHAWNVKRLKPKSFVPYDLDRECYTNMLWAFEGITAYYDDLLLRKAGLISAQSYLDLLAKNISSYLQTPGRKLQSLSESSFDAWIKFYRPNENSHNSTISYYLKGSLAAMCLDLLIRTMSKGQKSLNDAMLFIFTKYGNNIGVSEEEWFSSLKEATGFDGTDFLTNYIYGTKELPISELLHEFGIDIVWSLDDELQGKCRSLLGLRFNFDAHARAIISYVDAGSAAMKAGLSAGDEIIAINNIRLDDKNAADLISSLVVWQKISVCYSRKKRILNTCLIAMQPKLSIAKLSIQSQLSLEKNKLINAWVGC